jgi:hypothetical protein
LKDVLSAKTAVDEVVNGNLAPAKS